MIIFHLDLELETVTEELFNQYKINTSEKLDTEREVAIERALAHALDMIEAIVGQRSDIRIADVAEQLANACHKL